MTDARTRPLRVRMSGRDIDEPHRASTPLELLFDLTFVVAVSRVAAELGHSVAEDRLGHGLVSYLMLFFAIWWAWVNFTWFASAYDTDDVGYRVLTMLQMAGVLVLAAGVKSGFEHSDFTAIVIGYVIMRVALIAQWLRAASGDLDHRRTALHYAGGVFSVQVAWSCWLLVPHGLRLAVFVVLACCEMLVPMWAERGAMTTWHPEHITERFGLFTIIVLGECVAAASTAIETGFSEHGVPLTFLGIGTLVLLFGLWWLYYLADPAEQLRALGSRIGFRFGYLHYGIFAAIAAIGAGIEVAAESATEHLEVSGVVLAYAVAVPVSIFLLLLWILHSALSRQPYPNLTTVLPAIVATLVIAAFGNHVAVSWLVAAMSLPTTALVAISLCSLSRAPAEPAPH